MTPLAAFIGGWELLLIAAVLGVLRSGLKGRHSTAQGKALGYGAARNQALKGRHSRHRVSPFQGLIHFRASHPGLCPGLSNDAPMGLGPQPGGLPEISRGLRSAATTPPVHRTKHSAPRRGARAPRPAPRFLAPFQGAFRLGRLTGGVAFAQPPANFRHGSTVLFPAPFRPRSFHATTRLTIHSVLRYP